MHQRRCSLSFLHLWRFIEAEETKKHDNVVSAQGGRGGGGGGGGGDGGGLPVRAEDQRLVGTEGTYRAHVSQIEEALRTPGVAPNSTLLFLRCCNYQPQRTLWADVVLGRPAALEGEA